MVGDVTARLPSRRGCSGRPDAQSPQRTDHIPDVALTRLDRGMLHQVVAEQSLIDQLKALPFEGPP